MTRIRIQKPQRTRAREQHRVEDLGDVGRPSAIGSRLLGALDALLDEIDQALEEAAE